MLYNKNQKHLQMLCNQSDRLERAEWVKIMGRQGGVWRFPKPCRAVGVDIHRATLEPLSDLSVVKSDCVFLVNV